jgi:hypothetical protein
VRYPTCPRLPDGRPAPSATVTRAVSAGCRCARWSSGRAAARRRGRAVRRRR